MNDISRDILTYLSTSASSEFYQEEIEILDHWEGSDNLLWRIGCNGHESVVKMFMDAGQARGRRQFDGQESFAPLGIAPRPLWFDRYPDGLARQVLVYEWMPGCDLDVTHGGELESLATAVAKLHASDPADVRRFCPNPINLDYFWRMTQGSLISTQRWLTQQNESRMAELLHGFASRSQAIVESALPRWMGVPPAPVHGDLRVENVVSSLGQVALLDWEMYGLGDPALEMASLLYLENQKLSDDLRSLLIDTYLSLVDQQALEERIEVYMRLLPLQSVCYLLEGMRRAGSNLFADPETTQFLQTTLHLTLVESSEALGQRIPEDLETVVNRLEWTKDS